MGRKLDSSHSASITIKMVGCGETGIYNPKEHKVELKEYADLMINGNLERLVADDTLTLHHTLRVKWSDEDEVLETEGLHGYREV